MGLDSLPSPFDALKAGGAHVAAAAAAAAAKKSQNFSKNNKSLQKKRKRKNEVSMPPIRENPFVKGNHNPTSLSIEEPSKSVSVVTVDVQKKELKNPFAKNVVMDVNVDEFVSNLMKEPTSFEPNSAACWECNDKVPFLFLAKAFDLIRGETGGNMITRITCNLLRTVIAKTPDDFLKVVYLLANKIAPAYQGLELGIGDALLIKALAQTCGATREAIKISYRERGDLGDVAKAIRCKQRLISPPPPLTVTNVFDTFRRIAQVSGNKSELEKIKFIESLIVAAKDCEPVYLIRLLQGKLRIKLAEKTLHMALGQASVYSEEHSKPSSDIQSPMEEAGNIVKQVYSVVPVYDKIIPALLSDGVWLLPKTCNLTPGVPIELMKAKPTTGVSEIMDKFQDTIFTCEYKYDGERAQIHYMEDGSVKIYSRNALCNTEKFPDVVAALQSLSFKKPSVNSFILDCEIVGYDHEKQMISPFQILRARGRKDVKLSEIKVDVCVFAFDMLYLNGKSLLSEQLNVRRKHLYDSFEEVSGYFQFATALTSNDLKEINKFLEAALNASCEGLMIKSLEKEVTYEPSERSNNWLKLKKDYMDSFGDSLDLVPIAAFDGQGKRKGVYGSFLLACYDHKNDEFQSICKIGTGFSEEVLKKCYSSLQSKVISVPKPYFRYGNTLKPDVWFEPSEVWEVRSASLSISPTHLAAVGQVDPIKGISLRFPRLVRFRVDKAPEDATSSDQVAQMYKSQANNPLYKERDNWENEASDDD